MINSREFPEHGLVVHQCDGRLTLEELARAAEMHCALEWCRLVLWDLGASDVSGLETSGIRRMARGTSEAAEMRAGGKTALVAAGEAQYGLCRMYEIFLGLEGASVETAIFRTRREGEIWLDADLPPGIGREG
jgi:hypothetical protein